MLLPDVAATRPVTAHPQKAQHRWRDGHHFGVFCCTITAATVLFVNIVLAIVAASKNNVVNGIGYLQQGDCNTTKRIDLWLHLLINLLSTLLLGASNYSMQCLSSPTRNDIDKAHRQHVWMDVGVPSIRNILRISWPRKILWFALLCSSFPLHLLYNSVVFSSISVSEYRVFGVTSDFLTGAAFDHGDTINPEIRGRLSVLQNASALTRLENEACVATFSQSLVSEWSDLLLVSNQKSTNNSYLDIASVKGNSRYDEGSRTLCLVTGQCGDQQSRPDPGHWALQSGLVDHCMALKAQQHCRLQISMSLLIAIIACNAVKIFCMAFIVWKLDPYPLVTLGDAIASFLESPGSYSSALNLEGG